MLVRIALSIFIAISTLFPAHAELPNIWVNGEYTWFYWPGRGATGILTSVVLTVVGAAILVFVAVKCLADRAISSLPCSCDECVATRARNAADRYDREAAQLLAKARHAEAHTQLTATLIDKERVDAEYGEIKQITAHDRTIRNIHRSGQ